MEKGRVIYISPINILRRNFKQNMEQILETFG